SKADVVTFNTVLSGLARHGLVDEAQRVFNRLEEVDITPDEISFTNMIYANFRASRPSTALRWFAFMKEAGIQPTVVTITCLLDGLVKTHERRVASSVARAIASSLLAKNESSHDRSVLADRNLKEWIGGNSTSELVWKPDAVLFTVLVQAFFRLRDS
ncbi:hypothetical protein HK405_008905, partial [Cladochytrium tenue]